MSAVIFGTLQSITNILVYLIKEYHHIIMRLFFLFLFITLNSFSQEVIIDDIGDLKNTAVDSVNHDLLLFYKEYYIKIDLKTYKKTTHKIFTDSLFYIGAYRYIAVDHSKYFVSDDGGMVYKFVNDSVIRIDNSFQHRMQTGSNLFSYDHRIYKYGGYGFWSVRNFFIYFDNKTMEWEVNDLIRSKEIPKGTYASQFVLNKDDIYLFGGMMIDSYKQLERIKNNETWKYNFTDHQWKYLGKNSILEDVQNIKYKNKIVAVGMNDITEIDIINNRFTKYEHNILSPRLSRKFSSFYLDHNFYCFVGKRGKISLKIMSENKFFDKKTSSGIFYKNYPYWIWLFLKYFLIPVLGILLIWFGFMLYRKNKRIVLLNNGIRIKNNFLEFDNESLSIIKLLLSEDEVTSSQVLSIVEKNQYSPAHNERIKVQKLNDINLKIRTLLGINEDIIQSIKSKQDKRNKIYKINKEYFFTKKKSVKNIL